MRCVVSGDPCGALQGVFSYHIRFEHHTRMRARRSTQHVSTIVCKGPAQVGRQVWSVRYQGELLGLWDHVWRTLKIVILVENHPQARFFRLAYYHPL